VPLDARDCGSDTADCELRIARVGADVALVEVCVPRVGADVPHVEAH
jgi:hypothetical protein